jgi:hypothetical protein
MNGIQSLGVVLMIMCSPQMFDKNGVVANWMAVVVFLVSAGLTVGASVP